MSWKPRLIEPDEWQRALDVTAVVFGYGPTLDEAHRREVDPVYERDRTFVLEDGDTFVATASAYSFELALPGGGALPMSGVSEVGVLPTHRRQGMLRALMDAVVDQALDREEALAGLTASEATIYRRFGFGPAVRFQSVSIDTQRVARTGLVTPPVGERVGVGGRIRFVAPTEAEGVQARVWGRHWRRYPGELRRPDTWWAMTAVDPEEDRDGATPRFLVVHEDGDGQVDGYAAYRLKLSLVPGESTLVVIEVAAASDAVEAALIDWLLTVDLIHRVDWRAAPPDLPLRWAVADSRAVQQTREGDHLWLRPLDVARCLASRRYTGSGGFVVEVLDGDRPPLGGRFRLDAGPGGADCERTDAAADLTVATAELGSVLLGGVAWSTLARAGLVAEHTPGALARADALFRPERPPYNATHF